MNYFGNIRTREEVLAELQRFVDRWPNRQYTPRQESLAIECDDQSLNCTAKGLLDFDDSSQERNARSWGVASFEYVLSFTSPSTTPKIIKESGDTKEIHKGTFPPSPRPPSPMPGYPIQPPAISGAPVTPCDELAANPTDRSKASGVTGVPYDTLQLQAASAIQACEAAAAKYPNEWRFQYQLARALQIKDRDRALDILRKAASAGYPAAFDNLGWIYYSDPKNPNPTQATQYFLQGVRLNDADAMVSLAEMIGRGYFSVPNPVETRIALYKKAPAL